MEALEPQGILQISRADAQTEVSTREEIPRPVYAIIDIETTGLSPWSERITCIGVQIIRSTDVESSVRKEPLCFTCENEVRLLSELWSVLLQNKVNYLVGWNIDGFDWPFLKIRSAILNVPLGRYFHKYSERLDLMNVLKCGRWAKLDDAAQALFGEGKIACNPVELWQEGKLDELTKYNVQDVKLTSRIFQRCIDCCIVQPVE